MVQQVVEIEISSLQANPLQPRGLITSESLVDLVESIKEHGILEPLMVAKTPAGYQIIAGERRWRAAKLAGLKTVPTIIRETSPRGMLEMALVENVQREDLNPLERAQAFIRLMEEFSLTNKEIAKRISKSPAYISNSIKLLSLPDALKDGLLSSLISEGHARALAAIQNPKLMVDAYKIILREKASVRRTEDVARRMKKKAGQPLHPAGVRSATVVSDEIDQMARKLTQALGDDDSVGVKLIRSRIQTKILIVLKGSLIDTEERLQKIYKNITSK